MDPKLRGYLQKQMHMVRHNFHLNDVDAIFIANFFYEAFQPHVYTIDQNLAAVFWTPDHVIFAGVYHIVVAFIFHECIIPLFAVYRKTIPPLTGEYGVPYIPMPEGRGFTAHLVITASGSFFSLPMRCRFIAAILTSFDLYPHFLQQNGAASCCSGSFPRVPAFRTPL